MQDQGIWVSSTRVLILLNPLFRVKNNESLTSRKRFGRGNFYIRKAKVADSKAKNRIRVPGRDLRLVCEHFHLLYIFKSRIGLFPS